MRRCGSSLTARRQTKSAAASHRWSMDRAQARHRPSWAALLKPGRHGARPASNRRPPKSGSTPKSKTACMTVTPGHDYNERTQEQGISAQLDWDLGFGHLTSITVRPQLAVGSRSGHRLQRHRHLLSRRPARGLPELLARDPAARRLGPLNWLVGGYYGDEKLRQTDTIRVGDDANTLHQSSRWPAARRSAIAGGVRTLQFLACHLNFPMRWSAFCLPAGNVPPLHAVNTSTAATSCRNCLERCAGQQADIWSVHTQNWAIFTHDEFNITDRLQLTVGARYNSETKDLGADLNSISHVLRHRCKTWKPPPSDCLARQGPVS